MKPKDQLCECGCGNLAKAWNRFIDKHQNRGENNPMWKPKPESQLCECGCGEYALPGNRFINGHNRRGHHQSATHTKKIVKANKRYYENNPEKLTEMTKRLLDASKEYWNDPKNRNKSSKEKKQYYIDNPEIGDRISKTVKLFYAEMDDPGLQIVNHHYIYDHSDLSKYTMKMTRAKHAQIHAWMRKAGIVVPHINTKEQDIIMASELICDTCGDEILPTTRHIETNGHVFCDERCEAYYEEKKELI